MCMIDNSDGPLEMYDSKIVKGRKEHRCNECGRTLLRGESHELVTGKFDGTFVAYRTCIHCLVAVKWLRTECGGHIFTGVQEDIEEHLAEGYGLGVARLAVGMRRKWLRFDGGGLMPVPRMPKLAPASATEG